MTLRGNAGENWSTCGRRNRCTPPALSNLLNPYIRALTSNNVRSHDTECAHLQRASHFIRPKQAGSSNKIRGLTSIVVKKISKLPGEDREKHYSNDHSVIRPVHLIFQLRNELLITGQNVRPVLDQAAQSPQPQSRLSIFFNNI